MAAAPLTLRAYARHRRAKGLPGGSLQAVQRALKRGWIHAEPDGRIEPRRADRYWAALHVERPSAFLPGTRRLKSEAGDRPDAKADQARRGSSTPRGRAAHEPAPDNLVSRPFAALFDLRELLGEMIGPLFRLSGKRADLKAAITRLAKVPELLMALEEGMLAAGVPLLESDMPAAAQEER